MEKSFEEIRCAVSGIYVNNAENGDIILRPKDNDLLQSYRRDKINIQITGDGSESNPYRYLYPVRVSEHFAVVDLWYRFHNHRSMYIEVNNWLLQVIPNGVISEDGHMTRIS